MGNDPGSRATTTSRSTRMSRRAVLRGLAAFAASGWIPATLAQGGAALSASQFATLGNAYAGYTFDDPAVASAMLRALDVSVGRAALTRLVRLAAATPPGQLDGAIKAQSLDTVAETVVVALYSGIVQTPKGPRVVSYDDALVWQACAWTKPNGFCGGVTNYWSTAPAGVTGSSS